MPVRIRTRGSIIAGQTAIGTKTSRSFAEEDEDACRDKAGRLYRLWGRGSCGCGAGQPRVGGCQSGCWISLGMSFGKLKHWADGRRMVRNPGWGRDGRLPKWPDSRRGCPWLRGRQRTFLHQGACRTRWTPSMCEQTMRTWKRSGGRCRALNQGKVLASRQLPVGLCERGWEEVAFKCCSSREAKAGQCQQSQGEGDPWNSEDKDGPGEGPWKRRSKESSSRSRTQDSERRYHRGGFWRKRERGCRKRSSWGPRQRTATGSFQQGKREDDGPSSWGPEGSGRRGFGWWNRAKAAMLR